MDSLKLLFEFNNCSVIKFLDFVSSKTNDKQILELISSINEVWQDYEFSDLGEVSIIDIYEYYIHKKDDNNFAEKFREFLDKKLKEAEHDLLNSQDDSLNEKISYWKNYPVGKDLDADQFIINNVDPADFAYENIQILSNSTGFIWSQLYKIDFLFRHQNWNEECIIAEISFQNKFISFVYSMSSEFLHSEDNLIPENDLAYEAREYYRIINGYYRFNSPKDIGIYTNLAWVYGKYVKFHSFLEHKLSEIRGGISMRQHALYCYYISQSTVMFNKDILSGRIIPQEDLNKEYAIDLIKNAKSGENIFTDTDASAYAIDNSLDKNLLIKEFKKINDPLTGTESRTRSDEQNISDLNAAIRLLSGCTQVTLAEKDLSTAQLRNLKMIEHALLIYYKSESYEDEKLTNPFSFNMTQACAVYAKKYSIGAEHLRKKIYLVRKDELRLAYKNILQHIDNVINYLDGFPIAQEKCRQDVNAIEEKEAAIAKEKKDKRER